VAGKDGKLSKSKALRRLDTRIYYAMPSGIDMGRHYTFKVYRLRQNAKRWVAAASGKHQFKTIKNFNVQM